MPTALETIQHQDQQLGIIVRSGFHRPGVNFLTNDDSPLQAAYMSHPRGHEIAPHVHQEARREIFKTQEMILVKSGRIRVDFYSQERQAVCSRELGPGDLVLLTGGGHGFTMLEESVLFEIKQGPYLGKDDKVKFRSVESVS